METKELGKERPWDSLSEEDFRRMEKEFEQYTNAISAEDGFVISEVVNGFLGALPEFNDNSVKATGALSSMMAMLCYKVQTLEVEVKLLKRNEHYHAKD